MYLNGVKNKKLIKFNECYVFSFIDKEDIIFNFNHPVSEYYLKLSDISINIEVSLKWSIWAYVFLKEVSKNLYEEKNIYKLDKIFKDCIEEKIILSHEEKKHLLYIDTSRIDKDEDFIFIFENFYTDSIYSENSKINFKLKINLREYLIISNYVTPVFLKY